MKYLTRQNILIAIMFILSTLYFIYQNIISISWDFGSYVLNAQYWFANGFYFELMRPPLMPFIIGILSMILGWKLAEYAFIILCSLAFMLTTTKLAKQLKFHPALFYAISLNFFLMVWGLTNGTELLSLIFLELCIIFILKDSYYSGFFLGLSALSRYTGLALFPILIINKNWKKIISNIAIFAMTLLPWFIYNFYKTGNFFTSIANQYANNFIYRQFISQPFNISHLIYSLNILLPFVMIGMIIVLYNMYKIAKNEIPKKAAHILIHKLRVEIIMFFLLFYSIFVYSNSPFKKARFFFLMLLPAFYFSYIFLQFIINKAKNKNLAVSVAAVIILMTNAGFLYTDHINAGYETEQKYQDAIMDINNLNLSNCSTMSNSWVMLNYLGMPSRPFSKQKLIKDNIEQGYIQVSFKRIGDPEYAENASFMKSLPILFENDHYYIIGEDKCLPQEIVDFTFVENLNKESIRLKNQSINENPCFILFSENPFFEKTCNLINAKGFKTDKNRTPIPALKK